MLKRLFSLFSALLISSNIYATLPIDPNSPLNWKNDLRTLNNEAKKEIYYWDILALLVAEPMPSSTQASKTRQYGLRNTAPKDDELLEIIKGIQGVLAHLKPNDVFDYLVGIEDKASVNGKINQQKQARCVRYIYEYLKVLNGDYDSKDESGQPPKGEVGFAWMTVWTPLERVKGKDRDFLIYINDFIHTKKNGEVLTQNYNFHNALKMDAVSNSGQKPLTDWKRQNGALPSDYLKQCSYERFLESPIWNSPAKMSFLDPESNQLLYWGDTYLDKKNWHFSSNANGVYTFRNQPEKIKLVTVFGTPNVFQAGPSQKDINDNKPPLAHINHPPLPHINKYGFLSNYWSTKEYDRQRYNLPNIPGATSKIKAKVIYLNGTQETCIFDHAEGLYHFGKLLIVGKPVKYKEYKDLSPYASQQKAGSQQKEMSFIPSEQDIVLWNKLMFMIRLMASTNPKLRNEFKSLENAILIEGNYRGTNGDSSDKQWGTVYYADKQYCDETIGEGDNKLGRIQMFVNRYLPALKDNEFIDEIILQETRAAHGNSSWDIRPGKVVTQ